jgi:hypothetical protein
MAAVLSVRFVLAARLRPGNIAACLSHLRMAAGVVFGSSQIAESEAEKQPARGTGTMELSKWAL